MSHSLVRDQTCIAVSQTLELCTNACRMLTHHTAMFESVNHINMKLTMAAKKTLHSLSFSISTKRVLKNNKCNNIITQPKLLHYVSDKWWDLGIIYKCVFIKLPSIVPWVSRSCLVRMSMVSPAGFSCLSRRLTILLNYIQQTDRFVRDFKSLNVTKERE